MTVKQTVEITNKLGMHARPAMKLFELMQGFDAEVLLRNDEGTEAEANSVIALLMLILPKDGRLKLKRPVHRKRKHWPPLSPSLILVLMKINLHHFDIQLPSNSPTIRKSRTEIVLNQRHLYILCAFHFQKNLKKTLRGIV